MKLSYEAFVAVTTETLLGISMPSMVSGWVGGSLPLGPLGVTVVPEEFPPEPQALSIVASTTAPARLTSRILDILHCSCT
jgi:hypothetical protein